MKMNVLVATQDVEYGEHLSRVLMQCYGEEFEVRFSSSNERFEELLVHQKFDMALLDGAEFCGCEMICNIAVPVRLVGHGVEGAVDTTGLPTIAKYSRISKMVTTLYELYAKNGGTPALRQGNGGELIAVWSPLGGVGKTTTALAYCASQARKGKEVTYLNLESFASTKQYFSCDGKSISDVFEHLDANLSMLIKGLRSKDVNTGIYYFAPPLNYEDIRILTKEDLENLFNGCTDTSHAVVVDLSATWDVRVESVLMLADKILLVVEDMADPRVQQFLHQHWLAEKIAEKTTVVHNRSDGTTKAIVWGRESVSLPMVRGKETTRYQLLADNIIAW